MKTLLFDLDGTLIDSRHDLADAVNHSLQVIGKPALALDEVIQHVGNGLVHLLQKTIGPVEEVRMEKAAMSFKEFYAAHCTDKTVLYPGVLAVLSHFSQTHRMGVVTNKPKGFAETIIQKLGVQPFVSVIIGGDSLPQRKPDPAPLLQAIEELGGERKTTWIIGDGHQDIEAGQRGGLRTCVARYGFGFRPDVMTLKPDQVIDEFSELKEIVR